MKRAAIYARFSSDRQNERSAEDQIDLCRAWAERGDFSIVETFQDNAISGASAVNRMGLERLRRAARAGQFEVIIAEALDRISRDQADLAQFKKEMTFLGIAIFTVQDGEVGAMHVGLKGLMGEMYLADLAQKTRRGLRARVKAGASAGGRSYGYRLVEGKPGELTIDEVEAETVTRIFADYLAGTTPRRIASALNAEGVPGPRGGKWNASTINGSRTRQNGILQNRLYIGEIVWNRQRFIKDPATGKRVSRPNAEAEWLRTARPELAIVDRAIFDKANGLKVAKGTQHAWHARRPRHLLSGLVKCGCCGGSYIIAGRDRLACSRNRERGDCSNTRSVGRQHVEERVLASLQSHLGDPELVAEFVRAYTAERHALAETKRKDLQGRVRREAELTRTIDRIVDAVCDGSATKEMMARCKGLEEERDRLRAEIAEGQGVTEPVRLHPAAAERYRRMVAELRTTLDRASASGNNDVVIAEVRKLLGAVVITPTGPGKRVDIDVQGQLAELLAISTGSAPYRGSLVAGTGFEPVTFRL